MNKLTGYEIGLMRKRRWSDEEYRQMLSNSIVLSAGKDMPYMSGQKRYKLPLGKAKKVEHRQGHAH